MNPCARVGIIADIPVHKHRLQQIIVDAGYDVAICLDPDKVNPALLKEGNVTMWVVDLQSEDECSTLFDDLIDFDEVPIIFGEGETPSSNADEYKSWKRRLLEKLEVIAEPSFCAASSPVIDLSNISDEANLNVIELPEPFRYKTKTDVDEVWVICASLGGPEAVKAFFDSLPSSIPIAFIYAQHISQSGLEGLATCIGRHSQLNFKIGLNSVQLENGSVVIAPVASEIEIRLNNAIQTLDNPWPGPYGPSFDQLINNVIKRYKSKANCIIFSGMDSDGSIGVKMIHQQGGQVWGQSAASCVQSSMPDQAAKTGAMSLRDTPENLAKALVEYIKQKAVKPKVIDYE